MNKNTLINIPLWILVLIGFAGATKVSYENLTGSLCPHLFTIPICYIVFVAYGLMLMSLIINSNGCKHHFFCIGWGTAFVIALFASIAEVASGGGICPASGGSGLRGAEAAGTIPLCFISLAMLVAILILFIFGPYKKACELS